MLFPTFTFAVFLIVVLTVGWALYQQPLRWKLFMLAASYVFYGWWDWRFVGLIMASTVVNQALATAAARAPNPRAARIAVGAAVAANLGVLGFFKYYGFFVDSVSDLFETVGMGANLPLLRIILPVGISFFTFQAMSYVIDVHRRVIPPASALDFAVYLAFFPQLVAGPIVRASEFLPQLAARRDPYDVDLTRAAVLIGSGLFKKVVISSYLAEAIVDDVFALPDQHSALEVLVGIYGYAIQIYADFSGYSDIAIGVALLLGFRFPENFDRPYIATSIQDFWRRWHMSLSRWLRDYLYISLGGNRGGPARRDRNLFLTMLLGGLWHGAAWTFVFWGAYHGIGLLVERRVLDRLVLRRAAADTGADDPRTAAAGEPTPTDGGGRAAVRRTAVAERRSERNRRIVGRLVTFHFVCVGWVFFRADSMGTAFDVLGRLVAFGAAPAVTWVLVLTIAAALVAQYVPRVGLANVQSDLSRLPVGVLAIGFGVWLVVIDLLGPEGVAPFIYFQF
ncbi:MAG: MBOAT family protein [Actinomycetota bacterium]|nr:MBOAT family protein [Actinomycetota bacterium]